MDGSIGAVRRACPGDERGIASVHVDTWRHTYRGIIPEDYLSRLAVDERRTANWLRRISDPQVSVHVVVDREGKVVGFACGGRVQEPHPVYCGELHAIYVRPDMQGRGLGRSLFAAVVSDVAQMGFQNLLVWVLKENRHRDFYERLGGRVVDEGQTVRGGAALALLGYGFDDLTRWRKPAERQNGVSRPGDSILLACVPLTSGLSVCAGAGVQPQPRGPRRPLSLRPSARRPS